MPTPIAHESVPALNINLAVLLELCRHCVYVRENQTDDYTHQPKTLIPGWCSIRSVDAPQSHRPGDKHTRKGKRGNCQLVKFNDCPASLPMHLPWSTENRYSRLFSKQKSEHQNQAQKATRQSVNVQVNTHIYIVYIYIYPVYVCAVLSYKTRHFVSNPVVASHAIKSCDDLGWHKIHASFCTPVKHAQSQRTAGCVVWR